MIEGPSGQPKVKIQPPYPLAMVICDMIYKDPATGKRTILGCFSAIFARQFPAVTGPIGVYVALTDGHGKVPFKLRLVDAEEEKAALVEVSGEAQFDDPRAILEIDLVLQQIVIPSPGEYRFQLTAGDELIIERRIVVVDATRRNEDDAKNA